jgi:uncharacterized membrane protein YobD (UPF0266 family)
MKDVLYRLFIKLTSSKVLVTIAAIVLLYIIVIGNRVAFKEIGYVLAGIWASYSGFNVLQKYVDKKDE